MAQAGNISSGEVPKKSLTHAEDAGREADAREAKKEVEKILDAAHGATSELTEAERDELRAKLYEFVGRSVDRDLGGAEFSALRAALQSEARKWVSGREVQSSGVLDKAALEAHKVQIQACIEAHLEYSSGEWRKINKELAAILGVATENFTRAKSIEFGKHIQRIVGYGDDGRIGPRTLQALGKFLSPAMVETGAEAAPQKVDLALFTHEQKLEMLTAAASADTQEKLTEAQTRRLAQVDILHRVLESVSGDIENSRTWTEWGQQALKETSETTAARKNNVENLLAHLDEVTEVIKRNPDATVDSEMGMDIKKILVSYKCAVCDVAGNLKDPSSFEDLQTQYLELLRFLRAEKNYEEAAKLVEETLLASQFEEKRNEISHELRGQAQAKAERKIAKMITDEMRLNWQEGGMTLSQITEYEAALVEEERDRALNKEIAGQNDGRPFSLGGKEGQIMEMYRDMMGTGTWDMADTTWDFILEELVMNAPLIVLSGGVAFAARAGLSAGARLVMTGARFAKLVKYGRRTVGLGKMSTRALYTASKYAGKGAGLLFEGAVFETVNQALHGKWIGNMPDWGKRILWSTATLGVFHWAGVRSNVINAWITKNVTKVTEKSVAAVIQALAVKGNVEAAAMLLIGSAQHGVTQGDFDDYEIVDQIIHAYISVGSLKVAGSTLSPILQAGAKTFVPNILSAGKNAARAAADGLQKKVNEAETAFQNLMPEVHDPLAFADAGGGGMPATRIEAQMPAPRQQKAAQKTAREQISIREDVSITDAEIMSVDAAPSASKQKETASSPVEQKPLPEPGKAEVYKPQRQKNEHEIYAEMTPEQKAIAKEMKSQMPDIAKINLYYAILRPTKMEGLPETQGAAEVYLLPALGSGGFGMVREIAYKTAEGKIARKLIKTRIRSEDPKNDQRLEALFKDEAMKVEVMERVGEHPNLMKGQKGLVKERTTDSEGNEVVIEHLVIESAGDMRAHEYLHQSGTTVEQAIDLLFQVMDGADYMHDKGLVHRDLKWTNTMVNTQTGQAKIIDFGTLSAQTTAAPTGAVLVNPQLVALRNSNISEANQKHGETNFRMVAHTPVYRLPGNGLSKVASPVGKMLTDQMGKEQHFDVGYDHVSIFKMIIEVTQRFPKENHPLLNLLVKHAMAGYRGEASPTGRRQVFQAYRALREIRDSNRPQAPL